MFHSVPPHLVHSLIAWLLFLLLVAQAWTHEVVVRKAKPGMCRFVGQLIHMTSLTLIAFDCAALLYFAGQVIPAMLQA